MTFSIVLHSADSTVYLWAGDLMTLLLLQQKTQMSYRPGSCQLTPKSWQPKPLEFRKGTEASYHQAHVFTAGTSS